MKHLSLQHAGAILRRALETHRQARRSARARRRCLGTRRLRRRRSWHAPGSSSRTERHAPHVHRPAKMPAALDVSSLSLSDSTAPWRGLALTLYSNCRRPRHEVLEVLIVDLQEQRLVIDQGEHDPSRSRPWPANMRTRLSSASCFFGSIGLARACPSSASNSRLGGRHPLSGRPCCLRPLCSQGALLYESLVFEAGVSSAHAAVRRRKASRSSTVKPPY